jgi:proline dehydrogenase
MLNLEDTEIAFKARSTAALRRAQLLFRSFGSPTLVQTGPRLLNVAMSLHLPVKPLIKWTVFQQFCGGETLDECMDRVRELAKDGIRSILDYSVEGLGREADFDATAAEVERTITLARGAPDLPFAVFKVTGIARFELLEKVAAGDELAKDEQAEWRRAEARFQRLCAEADAAGIRILVDAEESWIQPAIDALAEAASRRHNKRRAVVYNTLQMYRHDRYAYLERWLETARAEGFVAGVKLVRGAYMEKERARAAARGEPSPIQRDKAATDEDFDRAVTRCLASLDHASLFAGTHNERSTQRLAEQMGAAKLAANDARVEFSQLLGMSDHLSYNLAHHGFNVSKYVPYGPVRAVMPYLSRRAAENSSIQGQAGRELQLIERELKRRCAAPSPPA